MPNVFWMFCVFFILLLTDTEGLGEEENDLAESGEGPLQCYFCHGMGPDNECKKFEPYKKARDAAAEGRQHDGPVTLKTCTHPFDKSCIIETYGNNNGEIAHIRDCSDDETFDFTEIVTNISSYSRLLGLHDNNETACSYDSQNMVCLSKCGPSENMTNFCNGPQFDSTDSTRLSKLLFFTTIFFLYIALPATFE